MLSFLITANPKGHLQSAVLTALQENIILEPQDCKTEETASCNAGHSLQFLVDGSFSFMEYLPDSYTIFS
jgi:hypothetical protein